MTKQRVPDYNYNSNLGLKQGHAITAMPIGSLLDVQNMNLNGKGGKSTRKGYQILFELPVTEPVISLHHYQKLDGASEVLSYANDTLYKWDGSSVTSLVSSLTTDIRWQFDTLQDRVYAVNGIDDDIVYDGTNTYKNGLTAPSHVSLSVASGGSLAVGAHAYVVTFYDENRGAESNPPDITTAPTATTSSGNQTITFIQPTAASGEQVTHIRVYRKLAAETIFTRIDEIAYSAGATVTDDGLTSGSLEVERDTGQKDEGNTPPPQSKIVASAFNRLFLVDEENPTNLIYSKQGAPHAFPSGNYFRIGDKDGARILKAEKHGEGLLIHKRNSVYFLYLDPVDGAPKRISGIGTQDVFAAQADVENYCYRLTPKGFYRFVPTDTSATDLREEYIGDDVSDEQSLINWDDTGDVTTFHYNRAGSRHVYFFFPNSSDFSTKALVYDLAVEQWVKYSLGTDLYSVSVWEDSGEQKMIFGDGYGMVWEWDKGDSDGHDETSDVANGVVTSATSNTITDSTQSWATNQFKGLIFTIHAGTGANQRLRIASNTSTTLTFTTSFTTTPDTTSQYSIGAIEWYADEFWNANDYPNLWKRMRWIVPHVRQTGNFIVGVKLRRDFRSGFDNEQTLNLILSNTESLWGYLLWGVDTWGSTTSTIQRLRFNGKYHYYSLRYEHARASERGFWDGHASIYQLLYDRNK